MACWSVVFSFARVVLLSSTFAVLSASSNGADDDLDPRSVEWVCASAPERVRALFDSLNLERPGLEAVKRAVGAGDYPTACTH
jgi:hypothetical protein